MAVPDVEGYVMVLQPEEPKISLSGIDHFARSAAEFESQEGVTLFPELRIVSTITREVETDPESELAEGADDDPTGKLTPTTGNSSAPMALLSYLPLVEGFQRRCDTCEMFPSDRMCRHSYHTVNSCIDVQ